MVQQNNYTAVAKLLHWVMAALIMFELLLAYLFGTVHHGPLSNLQSTVYWLHFNIGYTILFLLIIRIIWRLFNKPPALPIDMHKEEAKLAHLGHIALYVMLTIMVVTGALRYSIHTGEFYYLNMITIPTLVNIHGNENWPYTIIATTHNLCGALLVATIAVHVAMAIRHHIIDKNDILFRMLPKHCKK